MPEWFRRKRPHHRSPPIRPKSRGKDRHRKSPNPSPTPVSREAAAPHDGGFHRLAVSKGMLSAYDKFTSTDQTVDGITCSTGEDIAMLLQTIQSWIQQSSKEELEDVLVIVLNLNELTNSSLGSRTPSPPPTPPPTANHTTAAPMLSNEEFFAMLQSPNTNNTIKAALPNMISLKDIFLDTFKSTIYSPYQLESDRQDLMATWWKSGQPVGIDYYNTTVDPVTGRTQTTTGWPTSDYLTDVINRRIVVGFGANNLKLNTSYNIADDFTTIYRPGFLGPSMTNSSLIKITSSLNHEQCNFPMSGMMMQPTGREENWTSIQDQKKNLNESITTEVSWSFASMSDANSAPWTYSTGQLAWIVYEKGANNYRDVTCPDEYQFDVPRTARENQLLYQALLSYLNETNPSLFNSLMNIQSYDNRLLQAELLSPYSSTAFQPLSRRHEGEKEDGQDEGTDDQREIREPKTRLRMKEKIGEAAPQAVKGVLPMPARAPTAAVTGQGLIWIDISSWQTAGCWVPGGVHGKCPYQDPDNTVALQEIIKVSSIGGVIILVLVGMFLYLKCRRNVRLRKANKRRTDVRTKIMRTEVETVPA
ncbi:hypothetical protein BGZ93_005016 [Podila epicladia]|nr:hypothetical protein BGZ92_009359 [Podila epicladia]KAG0096083.1 hypothetical protein BGZ93_005016 [Podila epicladia]